MSTLLHHLLEASAHSRPDGTAIVDRERTLSYAELDEQANRLAHVLHDLGVSPGDRVGLFLDKSLESLIAIYGILKAGGTYVPFDPQAPIARLAYIARNAEIRCLATGGEKASGWRGLAEAGAPLEALVVLNATGQVESPAPGVRALTRDALAAAPATAPAVERTDSDLAYILYTSGSTGDPKGVMLSHRNALAFVEWAGDEIGVTASDRLSSHAPLHFDLSVFDLFAAARTGASVTLVPPESSIFPIELARWIQRSRITVWYSVPSVLSMLAQRGNLNAAPLPELRAIVFAGEVFPVKYLVQLMELLPHVRFHNWYGPTETNVCTAYPVPPLSEGRPTTVPIGKAIGGVEVFEVDENGERLPPGEVGELWVRGPTVMQGYWGDPYRSARSLIVGSSPEESVYKTGDLVSRQPDGNYLFLGRSDAQIKSRGYRIELGEIETALYAHPGVVECAVTAVPDEMFSNRIKAYVVVRHGVDEADLIRFCRDRLPRYMVPEMFEFRDELPKSSTGKIARRQLGATSPST
jgi:amino acid adenylation domain-containing protein